jgi:membrane protease YdiL (CAAX protease family)/ferredoxin
MSACSRGALKVGRTYLKVDWARCDACGACARVCASRAIVLRGAPKRAGTAHDTRPVARHSTNTPRARSAAKIAEVKASGKAAIERAATAPVKGGKRGGFQWTLLEAIAMLSVTFSAFTVKETLSLSGVLPPMPQAFDIPVRVGLLTMYYLVQVAVLVWLVRRRGGHLLAALGLTSTDRGVRGAFTSSALVVLALVATRLVASAYAYLTQAWGLLPSSSTDLPRLFGGNAAGFVLAVVMVVVVGPVVEEMVFRGALLEGLTAKWGPAVGIGVQALLFAAFHRSLWMLFPTFVLGLALGWLAHYRESLRPAIALHALYNGITVAAAFLTLGLK